MDLIAALGQQYKTEFETKYEEIHKRGLETIQQAQETIEQLQPQLQAKQEEIVNLVQDMSAVTDGYAKPLLEAFAWTAVLLLATYVASLVSGLILAPLIGLFVGGATAFLLAYIVLPLALVYRGDMANPTIGDAEIRFELFTFAVAEGALTGFLLAERYLATTQPLACVTPLFIAVFGNLAEAQFGTARATLLGITIGSSFAYHMLFGLVTGLSLSYFVLVLLYSGAGYVAIQKFFQGGDYSPAKLYLTMFVYYMAVLYAQLVVFTLFGGSKEAVQANNKE